MWEFGILEVLISMIVLSQGDYINYFTLIWRDILCASIIKGQIESFQWSILLCL